MKRFEYALECVNKLVLLKDCTFTEGFVGYCMLVIPAAVIGSIIGI